MCHQGTITISLKNNIIYVYVYVKGFILQGDVKVLERREGICLITIRFEDTAIDRCESPRRRF